MFAVIKTGGKQYKVAEGDVIKIEKLDVEEGKTVKFDEVLFIGDDKDVKVGTPTIKGASVEAKVTEQARHAKVWGIKHKAKKRYKLKFGHKQYYTAVQITKVA